MSIILGIRRVFGRYPSRTRDRYRFRLFAASTASTLASVVFVALYYVLFRFVPSTTGDGLSGFPRAPWIGKFDIAQFLGTSVDPPYPTDLTWAIGFATLLAALFAYGLAYTIALAWAMRPSSAMQGLGFGLLLFAALGVTIWLAPGFQPAVMRGALPDVGFFLLGWSAWATLSLLASCTGFGLILGIVYRLFGRTVDFTNLRS